MQYATVNVICHCDAEDVITIGALVPDDWDFDRIITAMRTAYRRVVDVEQDCYDLLGAYAHPEPNACPPAMLKHDGFYKYRYSLRTVPVTMINGTPHIEVTPRWNFTAIDQA